MGQKYRMVQKTSQSTSSVDPNALFLAESLKEAHHQLLSAIDELERLTSGPMPDKAQLVSARWNVSRASLERRLLWGRIHLYLAKHVSAKAEDDLRELQESDIRLLRISSAHVNKWTPEAIIEDWAGYCRASDTMRSKMRGAIETERRLLYPIFEGLGAKFE